MIVQKYGGTSVATTEKIAQVAKEISLRLKTENKIIVVVSAQSGETDHLANLATKMSLHPPMREFDQLVCTGENKSVALLCMALAQIGVKAKSLTGWQAGIVTNQNFGSAIIQQISPKNVQHFLQRYDVLVVTGFQGVTRGGDITTLGKGGSDTTAVALAAVMNARCEIYTDVCGVFSADPRLVCGAKKLRQLSYDELMEMSASGAKVMETRSVEIAKKFGVDLWVGQSQKNILEGTRVSEHEENFEEMPIKNITVKDGTELVQLSNLTQKQFEKVIDFFEQIGQKFDQFAIKQQRGFEIEFLLDDKSKQLFWQFFDGALGGDVKVAKWQNLCKITLVGTGFRTRGDLLGKTLAALKKCKVRAQSVMLSQISLGVCVLGNEKNKAVAALCQAFGLQNPKINIAIVGATGLVGRTFLDVLAQTDLGNKIGWIYLFASAKSAGKTVRFGQKNIVVEELTENCLANKKIDYAFFAAGESVAKKYAHMFCDCGIVVIDNSSAFRMDKNVPLVVPEININTAKGNLIANPNCSTIQAVLPLWAIKKRFGVKRVFYSTYQAVSGSGQAGKHDLLRTARGEQPQFYPYSIYGNCLPHIGSFTTGGFTTEEMKMINETQKILGDESVQISATCVRVPVENCHAVLVSAQLEHCATPAQIADVLAGTENVVVVDDVQNNGYPINQTANGKNQVFVGRIRQDLFDKRIVHFWCVADNVRKGAAANGVQILQKLLTNHQ